jgi:hypothetical protein
MGYVTPGACEPLLTKIGKIDVYDANYFSSEKHERMK